MLNLFGDFIIISCCFPNHPHAAPFSPSLPDRLTDNQRRQGLVLDLKFPALTPIIQPAATAV